MSKSTAKLEALTAVAKEFIQSKAAEHYDEVSVVVTWKVLKLSDCDIAVPDVVVSMKRIT